MKESFALSNHGEAATRRLALSVRQDPVGCPAETDRLAGAYLNTVTRAGSTGRMRVTYLGVTAEAGIAGRRE